MANTEQPKKTRGPRKQKVEITVDNYMEFSAKDLWKEIEKLRNQPGMGDLKADNKILKMKLTRIANIALGKDKKEE